MAQISVSTCQLSVYLPDINLYLSDISLPVRYQSLPVSLLLMCGLSSLINSGSHDIAESDNKPHVDQGEGYWCSLKKQSTWSGRIIFDIKE